MNHEHHYDPSTATELAALNQLRAPGSPTAERDGVASAARHSLAAPAPLLSVAREGKWLKVDAKPAYR